MDLITDINKYILEELKNGKIKKEDAVKIIKKLNSDSHKAQQDIAVVGMGIRVSGASTILEFWRNLSNGLCTIKDMPENRIKLVKDLYDKEQNYVKCGYIGDIDCFDSEYFGINPGEANKMEPEQRLILETVVEAFELAGIPVNEIYGSKTGVFIGRDHSVGPQYRNFFTEQDMMALTGTYTGILASRVSYIFNLKGPSLVIDTACSSGLVALHTACQSLKMNECDTAIVGGVHLNTLGIVNDYMSDIRSKDGITRIFDNDTTGTMWGEGVGVVILKRLDDENTKLYNKQAIIKGSAINSDGASNGLTAPDATAQMNVIINAWKDADIDPASITYIEAHGTGTLLGDPVEIKGITNAFEKYTKKKQFCGIGSVKANIGHTVAAAGIISLIKVILSMKYKKKLPSIFFNKPNKYIKFHKSPVYINDQFTDWEVSNFLRRAGVSSFGFSGTNCHVVLEEYNSNDKKSDIIEPMIFTISAKTIESLEKLRVKYIKFLKNKLDLDFGDICYTTTKGRSHYEYRIAIVSSDVKELIEKLTAMDYPEYIAKDTDSYFKKHKLVSNKNSSECGITKKEKNNLTDKANEIIHLIKNTQNRETYLKYVHSLCNLYVNGAEINWKQFYEEDYNIIDFPTYAFEKRRYWMDNRYNNNLNNISKEYNFSDELFYKLKWGTNKKRASIINKLDGPIMIFRNNDSYCNKICENLKNHNIEIIEVFIEENFNQVNNDKFTISGELNDYVKLFKLYKNINSIVHIASVCKEEIYNINNARIQQIYGNSSIFYILKALYANDIKHKMNICIVSTFGVKVTEADDKINPFCSMLYGLSKVIQVEHSNLNCKFIDIDYNSNISQITDFILNSDGQNFTAFRNGLSYHEIIDKVDFKDISSSEKITFSDDGVYIILGGLGGLGVEIADYISKECRANIILIGRTQIPSVNERENISNKTELSEKIEKLNKIKSRSKLEIKICDITSPVDMGITIKNIIDEFGHIDGIINCAGVFDEKLIVLKELDKFNEVIKPKVEGTLIIDELANKYNIKFLIIFSSISSKFGFMGQGAYAAANAFLDGYAEYNKNKRIVVINWGIWRDTGGALKFNANIDGIFRTLPTYKGIYAFDTILKNNLNNIIVTEIDFENDKINDITFNFELSDRVKKNIFIRENKEKTYSKEPKCVLLTGREDNNYTENERIVSTIWTETLGFEEFGIYDSFYELGGDSRVAIQIAHKLSNNFELDISLSDILKHSSINSIAGYIDNLEKKDTISLSEEIKQEFQFPLSSAQMRLYILTQINKEDISYNIPIAIKLEEDIDFDYLKNVLNNLINRHDSLKTIINVDENGSVNQIIDNNIEIHIEVTNDNNISIDYWVESFIKPFDIVNNRLFRVGVLKYAESKCIIVFDIHHIIADGISIDILINDFLNLYNGKQILNSAAKYKDYVLWHNNLINTGNFKEQEKYWMNVYKSPIPTLNLQTDFGRSAQRDFHGDKVTFGIDGILYKNLYQFAGNKKVTMYMLLFSVFNLLLMKYTDQNDIIIGTPISGRPDLKYDNTVGMFANTLAIRTISNETETFDEYLNNVKLNILGAFKNQDYPFEKLVEKVIQDRDLSRNPIFSVEFVMRDGQILSSSTYEKDKFSLYEYKNKVSKFDICLDVVKNNESLIFTFEFSTSLFKKDTMQQLKDHFINLLKNVADDSQKPISKIKILTEDEELRLIKEFNDTDTSYLFNKTILDYFDKQVNEYPDSIALKINDKSMTYKELNEKSNKVAFLLREKGILPNDIVAIMMECSFDMIIGIFGILKAGAGYLPIDYHYPRDRIDFILKDSNVNILLKQIDIEFVSKTNLEFININEIDKFINNTDYADIYNVNIPEDIAYVIYTSGTTGNPKGTLINHSNVVRLFFNNNMLFDFNKNDIWIMFHSYCFDFSVWEIFGALLNGGCLVLLPRQIAVSTSEFRNLLEKENVTVLNQTPTAFYNLLNEENKKNSHLLKLRNIIFGGEELTPKILKDWKKHYPDVKLINMYGITETTVHVTIKEISEGDIDIGISNIGKAIPTMKTYIFDKNMNIVPPGVKGELYISGAGLSRGYLNKPELTSQKFVQNIYDLSEIVYKSGDYAKWLPNGDIEYLGRIDNQIKIRGYRIELEEIKRLILDYDNINDAILTLINNDGETNDGSICAYIISDKKIIIQDIKTFLIKKLPQYMVPQYIIQINKVPMTSNHKIDLSSLPHPHDVIETGVEYKAPENKIEKEIAEIWSDILNIDLSKISINDNFFDLGGSSISIVKVHNILDKIFPNKLKVIDLFSYPSIKKISKFILNNSSYSNVINGLRIPSELIIKELNKVYTYNIVICDNDYDMIKEKAKIINAEAYDIFFAIYIFLISNMFQSDNFYIYYTKTDSSKIFYTDISLNEIQSIESLIKYARQKRLNNINEIGISELSEVQHENKDETAAFLFSDNVTKRSELKKIYAVILEANFYTNKVDFRFEFDNKLMSEVDLSGICKSYGNFINMFINSK